MMTKARSASWSPIKAVAAIPALIAVLIIFAGQVGNLTAQDTEQALKQKQFQEQQAKTVATQAGEEPVFEKADVPPTFPGGQEAMIQYLVSNIKYPDEAKKNGVQGTVFISYIVEKDGSITNNKVLKGVGSGCDEEAARVVAGMPKWTPGMIDGKPVRVQLALPIKFSLDDKKIKKEE